MHGGEVVRQASPASHPIDEELKVFSVKEHQILIQYPAHPKGRQTFEFSMADTFFYGKDIKAGIAKFMVYEARNMDMVKELIEDPEELKQLYRKLYKIQAMLPGGVKLNPTNHEFITPEPKKSNSPVNSPLSNSVNN
jgi:hypothetical protein